jgi:peroxiredoxin
MKRIVVLFSVLLISIITNAQVPPKGLNVNDKAPLFTAKDQMGKLISLKSALEKGPVVLVFYRGQWCPYCNKHLKKLEDSLSFIMAKGASVITITPEKEENITKTIEKTKATFPILFDDGLKIMRSYDVAFAVDDKTIEKYKGYGIDFNEANGTNGANLPVPALYIINKEGVIIYKYFNTDYSKRAAVADILSHL